jgi:DNA-binding NtrC family response regulator
MDEKTRILIVDDQLEMREFIRLVLKDKYAVATAGGAEEAFRYMDGNHVNMVLLDIKMPKIDGITALEEMKKRHPETEVILLSSCATTETIQKALKLGAFGYLIKPFDNNELIGIIDEALKNKVLPKI